MTAYDEVGYNRCQEAVKRLTEFLDHELGPDEEAMVQRHLGECHDCFARFHFEETLLKTIRERVAAIHAPGALRDRILGLITSPPSDTTE
jgi:anti-sigma factor (TIGR02949 family)